MHICVGFSALFVAYVVPIYSRIRRGAVALYITIYAVDIGGGGDGKRGGDCGISWDMEVLPLAVLVRIYNFLLLYFFCFLSLLFV